MTTEPDLTRLDPALEDLLHRSRHLHDAPEALIQRAIGVWQPRPAARTASPASAAGALRRLVAALSFDSATAGPVALGLRSGGPAARHMLFTAEGCDIELRLEPLAGGLWQISGQLLGPLADGTARLLRDDAEVHQVACSPQAEFSFPPVDGGACGLLLCGEAWEIRIPGITLPR